MRACGKAGQVEAAWVLFTKMLSLPQFLPDERALDSMYELCTSAGAHARALDVFREHSELRKTLFAPRLTPVSFTHLIRAGVEGGQMHRLGPVLDEMERFRVFPAVGTCARLLGAAVAQGELEVAARVVALTRRAGHVPDRLLLDAYDAERAAQRLGRGAGKAAKREGVARGAAAPAAAARALPSPRGGHAP
jgi:pentatricopeptide repeat protein